MARQLACIGGLTVLCFGASATVALARQPAAASAATTAPSATPAPSDSLPSPQTDPELTRPLTPLDQFNLTPPAPESAAAAPKPPPSVRYEIQTRGLKEIGLEAPFRQLSALQAGHGRAASELQIHARSEDDQELAERLLRSVGYYQGKAEITTKAEAPDRFRVLVAVAPGPQFHFASIRIAGPETEPPGIARQALTLAPGDPIVAASVMAAEANVTLRLPEQGYPFVKVGDRDIALDPNGAKGDYTLPVAPGPKSSFGAIEQREQVFDERHLRVIARYKPGQPYDSRMIDDFRRALVATGLFSAVGVAPVDTGKRAADGTEVADVQVRGRAGPSHTLSGSVGYETGEGTTLEAAWTALNLFPPEGALTLHAIAGSQQQLLGVQFTRSNAGARDRSIFGQIQSSRQDTDAYKAYTGQIQAQVSRASTPIWQKVWTYTAGVEGVVTDEQAFDLAQNAKAWRTYKIAGFRFAAGYDRSNSLLNPTRGFQILATMNPEAEFGAGDHGFVQATLEGRVYVPVSKSVVLAGRLREGALFGISAQDLAPSRRFYEGGGANIRGYGYQEVGPKAPDGSPIGGASSTDFSAELRYRFLRPGFFQNLGFVGFLDGGQVYETHTPQFTDFRYGMGVGARYYTNFGPIRLDVGTPVSRRPGESALGVYISIGQAF